MKKWTTILLLALLAALCLAVSCKNDPPPHEHEFDLTAWEHDEDSHWRNHSPYKCGKLHRQGDRG